MDQPKKGKIYPPTQLLMILTIQIVISFLWPIKRIIFSPLNYFGVILIISGIVINIWADNIFKKHHTTVKPDEKPTKLIDFGPFCFSRHPMYLGMTLILAGTAIWLGSLSSFLFPAIFFFVMHYKYIPQEEQIMEKEFGRLYSNYRKKTRQWI